MGQNGVNNVTVDDYNCLTEKIDPTHVLLRNKLDALHKSLKRYVADGVIIAFSGGVDSAFLVWAAQKTLVQGNGKVLALTTKSPSMPQTDLDDAIAFAAEIGMTHRIEKSREFSDARYLANDVRRCYYCKSELFRITSDLALNSDYRWVLYGYNASDTDDFRPGHMAAIEHKVVAPLKDAGLTKTEIRDVLHANKIELSEKPASPCLSSRIMTGIPLETRHLKAVAAQEKLLKEAGCRVFRVRVCRSDSDYFLRIETLPQSFSRVMAIKDRLLDDGKKRGYRWVVLDLDGYKTGGGNS